MVTTMPGEPMPVVTVTPIAPTRSLHRKLAQVMYEAERIPKNGVGPKEQGSYPFVRAGDAADYIRKALAEKVITMMPTAVSVVGQSDRPTSRGGTMTTVDLLTEWTLTDGESGESTTIMSFGAGADTGDKYSGKASTSAMKYALLTGFLLSTGDDTENSDTSDRKARGEMVASTEAVAIDDGSLIGYVIEGKPPCDLQLRQSASGPMAGFKLKQGRSGLQVLANGNLASVLQPLLAGLVDQRVSVWGQIEMVPWDRDGKAMPPYKRLMLNRIKTAEWTLPGTVPAAQVSEGPEGDEPPEEAPTAPLFDDDLAGLPVEWQAV